MTMAQDPDTAAFKSMPRSAVDTGRVDYVLSPGEMPEYKDISARGHSRHRINNGKDAVKKLLEIDPGARAIVSSGYSNDAVLSNYEAYGFKGMVSKPYRLEELAQVLQQVISDNI